MVYLISTTTLAILLGLWIFQKRVSKQEKPISLRVVTSPPPDAWEYFVLAKADFCENSDWIVQQIKNLREKIQPPTRAFLFEPTKAHYRLLASSRTVDLQEFVRQLCQHIDFKPIPVVSYDWDSTMKGSTIGQARLDSISPEIHVSLSYTKRPRELGALLAHELTHHFLDRASFRSKNQDENEKLTDLAAVFLGFGKLILNGADVRVNAKKRTLMKSPVRLGYLPMADLACAYDKVCCLNGISTSQWTKHLSPEAVYYVQSRATARKSSIRSFRQAMLRHNTEAAEFTRCVNDVLEKCERGVEILVAKHNEFSEGVSWINQNFHMLHIKKQDGNTMVQMNNEFSRLKDAVFMAQRHFDHAKNLSVLAVSDMRNATKAQLFMDSAQELLDFLRVETNLILHFFSVIEKYKGNHKQESR